MPTLPSLTLLPTHLSKEERRREAAIRTIPIRTWLVLLLAAAYFLIHGPIHASSNYANDFAAPYTSARLWLQHQNPYDASRFMTTWQAAGAPLLKPGGSEPVYANPSSTHSVYPPPSIVVLAPFALLSWPTAWAMLTILSTVLYVLALLFLTRLVPGTWQQLYKPAFLTIGLLFAPSLSALHVSNVTSLSATLLLFAVYLIVDDSKPMDRSIIIAVLLALSLSLKPTLAPFILLYLVITKRWRIVTITLGLLATLTATFQLLQPNLNWLTSLRSNIDFLFHAGVADLAERNLARSDRIDLQLPAYTLTHSRTAATLIAAVVTLILLALWFRFSLQSDPIPDHRILLLSTLLTLGLLPFYQRFYSAIVLLLPVLWALRNLNTPATKKYARWIFALCSVFLVNTSVVPRLYGVLSDPNHPLTEIFLTPHLCWLLLALPLLLLQTQRQAQNC